MKLCAECNKPLPPFTGRGRDNQLYCKEPCSRLVKNRRRAALYQRQLVRKRTKWHEPQKKYATVYYPGVDTPDYWTRKDYEMYEHALPEGTKVTI